MIPIHTAFGILLITFALIGSLRGWAKELIVAFSVIVALFFEHVLIDIVTPVGDLFRGMAPHSQFYTRSILFIVITVFGYATPRIASRLGAKVARERLQDLLLGFFLGVLNGFLIIGTLLSFLDSVQYGIPEDQDLWHRVQERDESGDIVEVIVYDPQAQGIGGIIPPQPDTTADKLRPFLPPRLIEQSRATLYVAVAVAFVFVIVVFI